MNKQKMFWADCPGVIQDINEHLAKGWYVSESYDCGATVFLLECEPDDEGSHNLNELRDYVKAKDD